MSKIELLTIITNNVSKPTSVITWSNTSKANSQQIRKWLNQREQILPTHLCRTRRVSSWLSSFAGVKQKTSTKLPPFDAITAVWKPSQHLIKRSYSHQLVTFLLLKARFSSPCLTANTTMNKVRLCLICKCNYYFCNTAIHY